MRFYTMVGIASVLAVGNAFAAQCPAHSDITQTAETQGKVEGIAYSVKNKDGDWHGFTPYAKKTDAALFKLNGRKPKTETETSTTTICQYESAEEGFNLVLKH
ncbi:hypothetical protein [Pseudomonas shirazensis]|uniref:hypothetical protein n=1 Tax=Pseudomonas shirazensis TaxID=2745494 RepID=UPI003D2C0EF7